MNAWFEALNVDAINALFELSAYVAAMLSIRQILIDKAVAGVSWLGCLFFPLWQAWDIFYYTALDQTWSFIATCMITYAETVYFVLLVYYGGIGLGKKMKVKDDT